MKQYPLLLCLAWKDNEISGTLSREEKRCNTVFKGWYPIEGVVFGDEILDLSYVSGTL